MQRITRSNLRRWAEVSHPHCLTVYMPLRTTHPQKVEDALLFGKLLDQAADDLTARGAGPKEVLCLLEKGRALVENHDFWRSNGSPGLCLLASPAAAACFTLPYVCATSVDVGAGFYITPLAYAWQSEVEYHLLVLSPKSVRLFRCRRDGIAPVELPADVPRRIEETEGGRVIEKSLQAHSGPRFGGAGSMAGVIHGHGDPKDDRKMRLIDFFHVLARHLEPLLLRDRLPVVLACVDYYRPLVRDAFASANIVDEALVGSHDDCNDDELWKQSLPIADALCRKSVTRAAGRFHEAADARRADRLSSVLPAAREGRVEQLFVALDQRVWGHTDGTAIYISPGNHSQPGMIDLSKECVTQTFLHDGDVIVMPKVQMPGERDVAATLRW